MFSNDNAPGIVVSAPLATGNFAALDFGNSAADGVLERVFGAMRSADFANADPELRKVKVDVAGQRGSLDSRPSGGILRGRTASQKTTRSAPSRRASF